MSNRHPTKSPQCRKKAPLWKLIMLSNHRLKMNPQLWWLRNSSPSTSKLSNSTPKKTRKTKKAWSSRDSKICSQFLQKSCSAASMTTVSMILVLLKMDRPFSFLRVYSMRAVGEDILTITSKTNSMRIRLLRAVLLTIKKWTQSWGYLFLTWRRASKNLYPFMILTKVFSEMDWLHPFKTMSRTLVFLTSPWRLIQEDSSTSSFPLGSPTINLLRI